MLNFNAENIYQSTILYEGKNALLVPFDYFIPFQFHLANKKLVSKIEFFDNSGNLKQDVTNIITIEIRNTTDPADGFWYLFYGINLLVGLECGYLQMLITFVDNSVIYSNFFEIVNYLNFSNKIIINDNTDKILLFSSGWRDFIYFYENQFTKSKWTFLKDDSNGDGSNTVEYQRNGIKYTFTFISDKWALDDYFNLDLFRSCTLYGYNIIDNIAIKSDFNENYHAYEITLEIIIKSIEKNNCNFFFDTVTTDCLLSYDNIFRIADIICAAANMNFY